METSDFELIERSRRGDPTGFEELYLRYVKRIYNLAYRMVGTGNDPEELSQEIFLQAFKNLDHFKGESSFYTWLYRVACNTCLQFLRKKSRSKETVNYDDLADVQIEGHESPDPLDIIERRDLGRRLDAAMMELPENQRLVLILGPIEGRSYEEMADILGVTVPIIKG
ncbi:MAG: sigma-70 family RNA polymerase sigma factor, partial [Candidatus Wallbacteria bacterium]|nr:sigma-70 family RNA polymerase sigma factor [Candidatus Wallbacteria bacterium]